MHRHDSLFTDAQEIVGRLILKLKMILLVHEMGTGKTCTAAKIIETTLADVSDGRSTFGANNRMKMVYVIVPSEKHSELFQSTIMDVCVPKQFSEELRCDLSASMRKRVQFVSYSEFAKISAQDPKRFEATTFIFDEIHTQSSEKLDIFAVFLKNIEEKIVVVMSGTPMIDKDRQLLKIFNFMRTSFSLPAFDMDHPLPNAIEEMKNHISFLKNSGDVRINMCTNHIKMGKYWKCQMSDFQRNVVMKHLLSELNFECNNEATNNAFYNDVIQASCFVFPDGSFGKIGFERFVRESQNHFTLKNPELFTSIKNYGTKFEEAMRLVELAASKGQCSFVFSMFVKGSGLILFSLLLQKLLNFEPVSDVSRVLETKRKRFLLVTGTTTGVNDALAKFNHPSNNSGEYISCILGSTSMTEGYSLNHIRNVIFLTPEWNFSSIYQIIFRGMRMNSHQHIADWNKVLDVYMLDAYTKVSQEEKLKCENKNRLKVLFEDSYVSFDMAMLNRAEEKDIPIQSAMYMMKVFAVDCELMRRFNVMDEQFSNTRQTENQPCDYACENTLTRDNHRNRIIRYGVSRGLKMFIADFFTSQSTAMRFKISIEDLFSTVRKAFPNAPFFEFIMAVHELIAEHTPMGSFLGQTRFITNYENMIMTTHDFIRVNPNTHFFLKAVTRIHKKGFPELAFDLQVNNARTKLNKMTFPLIIVDLCQEIGSLGVFRECVRERVLEALTPDDMQHLMIDIGTKMQSDFIRVELNFPSLSDNELVLFRYLNDALVMSTLDGLEYLSVFLTENTPRMICLSMKSSWTKCDKSIIASYFTNKQKITQMYFDRAGALSFVGSRSLTRDSFCVRKRPDQHTSDRRMIQVGKQLESFNPKELMEMYEEISRKPFSTDAMKISLAKKHFSARNLIIPKDASTFQQFTAELSLKNRDSGLIDEAKRIELPTEKKYLQTRIKHCLLKRELVGFDQSCGTQNKMRS